MSVDEQVAQCPVAHGMQPRRGSRLPGFVQTAISFRTPGIFTRRQHAAYGDVFVAKSLVGDSISVADPTVIESIFTAPHDSMHAGAVNATFLRALFGDRGILVVDGDEHTATRKALMPPFRGKAVAAYAPIIKEQAELRIASWAVGDIIAMHPEARTITLEVILRTVFGATDGAQIDRLRDNMVEATHITLVRTLWTVAPKVLGKVWPWRSYAKTIAQTNALLDELIVERRKETNLDDRTDTLSQLVRSSGENDRWIRDQLISLLGAGHETTTTALSWAVELLARHPEIKAKAREGDDDYLDAVINETLRLRAVIPALGRKVSKTLKLGGYEFPAGTTINPQIDTVHRDGRLWEDPETFRPERFLDYRPSTSNYFPFGGGKRRCIGALFAHLEMKVVLRTMLDSMDFEPIGNQPEAQKISHITLAPSEGGLIRRTR